MPTTISLLVEGGLDEAVGRRILAHCGLEAGTVYGKRGFGYIKEKLPGFARAGVRTLVLVDFMDTRLPCAGEVVSRWLGPATGGVVLRVVVRELESWLLADAAGVATFLGIPVGRVTAEPEALLDPKRTMIDLARRSRHRGVRDSMVPTPESGAIEGPAYTSCLQYFVAERWDPVRAAQRAPSLRRCLAAVERGFGASP